MILPPGLLVDSRLIFTMYHIRPYHIVTYHIISYQIMSYVYPYFGEHPQVLLVLSPKSGPFGTSPTSAPLTGSAGCDLVTICACRHQSSTTDLEPRDTQGDWGDSGLNEQFWHPPVQKTSISTCVIMGLCIFHQIC